MSAGSRTGYNDDGCNGYEKNRISLDGYLQDLEQMDLLPWSGVVTATVGLLIESHGPAVAIGDFCEVSTGDGRRIRTQVIGFRNGRVLAMPLDEPEGLQLGSKVTARVQDARLGVGPGLLGRVLDGFGQPMDGGPPIEPAALYPALLRAAKSVAETAYHGADGHGNPFDRQFAYLRKRPENRVVRRQRSGQEHATRRNVAKEFGASQRDCPDRRA